MHMPWRLTSYMTREPIGVWIVKHARLCVLPAGDLAKPLLGLAPEVWDALCGELDLVVHNGALVNHAFTYAEMFQPNVLGTAEVGIIL